MFIHPRSQARFTWREKLIAGAVALGFALPFIPLPDTAMTQMKIITRDRGNPTPIKFTAETPRSVCRVLAFSLAFEDHGTGEYRRVVCKQALSP